MIPTKKEWSQNSLCDDAKYKELYHQSITQPEEFWAKQAERLHWIKKWNKVKETSFQSPVSIKWFTGAKLNASYNCLDRHLEKKGNQPALIWESDDIKIPSKTYTYSALHKEVCKLSNALKTKGVRKGDCVTIYMPMIPEAVVAILACARIGAIHSVVFGGFSSEALAGRIQDCNSSLLITADEGMRGGQPIPLKKNVEEALLKCPSIQNVFVVKHTGKPVPMKDGRDFWYKEILAEQSEVCAAEEMDAEDPLFILYTSGSTGKPKGVLHTTGGYLLHVSLTHEYVFDYKSNEIYWCTADVGWVTGHSYVVYGPLANGATSLIFEGVPNYPTPSRHWQIIDKHKVNIYYTAPTLIRSLMKEGEAPVKSTSRKTLRLLGTVGEPINPEAWTWYYEKIGESRCPVVDTWWQTETGGILISPLPGAIGLKPGSATLPFFGVQPCLVDNEGRELPPPGEGNLCLKDSWPGQMRTIYGDHGRFESTYFKTFPGKYFTGDGCRIDEDGYYWITGRVDDVINVAGHRLGTAEIESALVAHKSVAEAAVVGAPHDIKGQGIYAFVTLKSGVPESEELRKELIQWVRKEISPIATPDWIQWAPGLPKTRSGKIMRRILRKIVFHEEKSIGDTSTLADPSVVDSLIKGMKN